MPFNDLNPITIAEQQFKKAMTYIPRTIAISVLKIQDNVFDPFECAEIYIQTLRFTAEFFNSIKIYTLSIYEREVIDALQHDLENPELSLQTLVDERLVPNLEQLKPGPFRNIPFLREVFDVGTDRGLVFATFQYIIEIQFPTPSHIMEAQAQIIKNANLVEKQNDQVIDYNRILIQTCKRLSTNLESDKSEENQISSSIISTDSIKSGSSLLESTFHLPKKMTKLHWWVSQGNKQKVEKYLKRGLLNETDEAGRTALDYARFFKGQESYKDIEDLLIQQGAISSLSSLENNDATGDTQNGAEKFSI